jgi:hypothetical protein
LILRMGRLSLWDLFLEDPFERPLRGGQGKGAAGEAGRVRQHATLAAARFSSCAVKSGFLGERIERDS